MSIKFRKTLDGSLPATMNLAVDQVDIDPGVILFWETSGYVSNAITSAYTGFLAGVSEGSVAAAKWATGATIPVQTNPMAVYGVDSSGTASQTNVGSNVTCKTGDAATDIHSDLIDIGTEVNDERGIARVVKLLTTSGTSQVAEVMLNFHASRSET